MNQKISQFRTEKTASHHTKRETNTIFTSHRCPSVIIVVKVWMGHGWIGMRSCICNQRQEFIVYSLLLVKPLSRLLEANQKNQKQTNKQKNCKSCRTAFNEIPGSKYKAVIEHIMFAFIFIKSPSLIHVVISKSPSFRILNSIIHSMFI